MNVICILVYLIFTFVKYIRNTNITAYTPIPTNSFLLEFAKKNTHTNNLKEKASNKSN